MKHTCTSTLIAVLGLIIAACSGNDKKQQIKGIGTICRTDSITTLHYYNYTMHSQALANTELRDSARVEFLAEVEDEMGDEFTLRVNLLELSGDITTPIAGFTNGTKDPKHLGKALFMPINMHMTRDFRRCDFFNVTTYYPTRADNDDYVCLTYDPKEQIADTVMDEPFVVLWLRLYQNSDEGNDLMEYKSISVPLNSLQRDTIDFIGVRVKYFGIEGDTITNDYTYSY